MVHAARRKSFRINGTFSYPNTIYMMARCKYLIFLWKFLDFDSCA